VSSSGRAPSLLLSETRECDNFQIHLVGRRWRWFWNLKYLESNPTSSTYGLGDFEEVV
jgi:hypothetical protein